MANTKKATPEKKVSTKKPTPKKTKAAKPKREKAPRQELCVFAIRLTQAERDKIHATAGPRNATHLIRAVSAAFANEDVKAFQAVLKEARELRG